MKLRKHLIIAMLTGSLALFGAACAEDDGTVDPGVDDTTDTTTDGLDDTTTDDTLTETEPTS